MEQTPPNPTLDQVETELKIAYPLGKALLSLSWANGAEYRAHEGPLDDILRHLRAFCARWPDAVLRYHPQHPYGLVCRIACGAQGAAPPGRPAATATLFVTSNGAVGPDLGLNGPPTPMFRSHLVRLSFVA